MNHPTSLSRQATQPVLPLSLSDPWWKTSIRESLRKAPEQEVVREPDLENASTQDEAKNEDQTKGSDEQEPSNSVTDPTLNDEGYMTRARPNHSIGLEGQDLATGIEQHLGEDQSQPEALDHTRSSSILPAEQAKVYTAEEPIKKSPQASQAGDLASTTNATRDVSDAPSRPETPRSLRNPPSFGSITPRSNVVSVISRDEREVYTAQDKTPTSTAANEILATDEHQKEVNGSARHHSEGAPEVLTNGSRGLPSQSTHSKNVSTVSADSHRAQLPNIHEHLTFLSSTKQMYDVVLQINQLDNRIPPSMHYAHSLLLLRSERLAKSLTDPQNSAKSRQLQLFPARNVLPHAFEAALRFFYTDQLLTMDMLPPRSSPIQGTQNFQWFEYIMSYWIAGVELGLTPIKARSFELLKSVLDWDIAELLSRENSLLQHSKDNAKQQALGPEVDEIANALLQSLLHLFMHRLDIKNFTLDTRAKPLTMPTRFERLERGRHGHNTSLSGVVFGSLPADNPVQDQTTSIASAILLHASFQDFEALANQLISWHSTDGIRLISEVIAERERAREAIVVDPAVPNHVRLEQSAIWHEVGFKEYIDKDQLQRRRVGYLLSSKGREF